VNPKRSLFYFSLGILLSVPVVAHHGSGIFV